MKKKHLLLLSSLLIFSGCETLPVDTSSVPNTSEVDELTPLKTEINTYLNSIDINNYRDDEKTTLQSLIDDLKALVNSCCDDKDQLEAAFSAFKTQYLSLKTKAEYEQEEKDNVQAQFDAKKKELLDSLVIESENQYREEELTKIKQTQTSLIEKVESAKDINELNDINITPLKELLSSSKTNAQYTMEEILPYGLDSDWALVNEHRDQMSLESDGTIKTKDDGYALDRTTYTGNIEIVFSVNTNEYCNLGGILLANKSELGDGLDGYVINIARGANFEYYQVYYLKNFYASRGTQFYQYIGGWVYNNDYPGEKVSNNQMRVIIERDSLRLFKNSDYEKYGESAKVCPVDLTNGGQFEVYNSYHFGIVTWGNGGKPFNLELDMLSGSKSVNGVNKAKEILEEYVTTIDADKYGVDNKTTITNKIEEVRNLTSYSDIINGYSSLKTLVTQIDADWRQNSIDAKKQELLEQLNSYNETQFRVEELTTIKAEKTNLQNQINSATTIDQLNNISFSTLDTLMSTTKTNAQYTMEEILPYGIDSDWLLVNEHRDQMSLESDGTIKTKDDGYALDSTVYSGDMEVVFSINTNEYCNVGGFLLANKTTKPGGTGLDGYLINVKRSATEEYYQIYYLNNGFNNDSVGGEVTYIGGWIYNNEYPGETVTNNKMRVIIKDGMLSLYKNADYLVSGTNSKHIDVDLTNGNQYDLYNSYHFGILTWTNGGVPFNFELDMLAATTSVSSLEKAGLIFENGIAKYNLSKYSSEDQAYVNEKVTSVRNGVENKTITYNEVFTALKDVQDYLDGASAREASKIMDAIFSDDNSEKSSWDAVIQNVNSWNHQTGTNTVTTPSTIAAGWQLTKDKYQDIDMTMNVKGCQTSNPYESDIHKAFLIGADSNGSYPKGYAVCFYQEPTQAWVQVHYMDGSGIRGTFIGGICEWVEDLDIRITVEGKELKIYMGGVQRDITNSSFAVVSSITLDNYNGGSIGVFNWDDVNNQTTFTLKEFFGTKK